MTTRREFLKAATAVPLAGMFAETTETPALDDRLQYLRSLCEVGLQRRYSAQPEKCPDGYLSKEVQERLDGELRGINDLDAVGSFLILWDMIQHAHKNNAFSAARGPANGSLVVYALGLSRVCPLKHGLLFERFLDSTRTRPLEVLIDLSKEVLEGVSQFVQSKYPELQVEVHEGWLRIRNDVPAPTRTSQFSADFLVELSSSFADFGEVGRGKWCRLPCRYVRSFPV